MLAAQELLVEREYRAGHQALVRRLGVLTRDHEEASDLAHEAFLRLTREVAAGRAPDEPAAWLYRVGANLAMSRGRHLAVVGRRAAALPIPDSPPSPEHVVVRSELVRAVRSEIEQLPSDERRALMLAAEGYPPAEIARLIGRSPGATRTMLCRTRSRLRTILAPAAADEPVERPRGGRMIGWPWSRCSVDERSSGGNGRSPA